MIWGVVFCDFGIVELDVCFDFDIFCVVLGVGLWVSVFNFGGVLFVFDLVFLVVCVGFDDICNFSFFMGFLW